MRNLLGRLSDEIMVPLDKHLHIEVNFPLVGSFRMGFLGDTEEALIKNIKAHPQIPTGDASVDTIIKDIFDRMVARDPKLLRWDEAFKKIVGLYDQATLGFIRP